MDVKAGAESEAKRLRRDLAREMFADCESELQLQKQAAVTAAGRITALEDQIRLLKSKLVDAERVRLSLESEMQAIEATEAAIVRERVIELDGKLEKALSELNRVGRSAVNANAETADAKAQAEAYLQKNDNLTQELQRLTLERDDFRQNISSLEDELAAAAEAAKAQISQLKGELIDSKRQLQAVIDAVRTAGPS